MKNLNRTFVYIIRCSDNSYYTGTTKNIQRRLLEHNDGDKGAKYTRSRRPVVLIYFQEFGNAAPALKEERRIKKLSRKQKQILIDTKYD